MLSTQVNRPPYPECLGDKGLDFWSDDRNIKILKEFRSLPKPEQAEILRALDEQARLGESET